MKVWKEKMMEMQMSSSGQLSVVVKMVHGGDEIVIHNHHHHHHHQLLPQKNRLNSRLNSLALSQIYSKSLSSNENEQKICLVRRSAAVDPISCIVPISLSSWTNHEDGPTTTTITRPVCHFLIMSRKMSHCPILVGVVERCDLLMSPPSSHGTVNQEMGKCQIWVRIYKLEWPSFNP